MAIEEVHVPHSAIRILGLTHVQRSSVLRSLTKRQTQSTAVSSPVWDDIAIGFLTLPSVDKAVSYILSQPDGTSIQ